MSEFEVRTLDAETWPAYKALLLKHNDIWGGCWCMEFQREREEKYTSVEEKACHKHELVLSGKARASLVFDGELAVGWCQFGPDRDLTAKFKFKRHYEKGLVVEPS